MLECVPTELEPPSARFEVHRIPRTPEQTPGQAYAPGRTPGLRGAGVQGCMRVLRQELKGNFIAGFNEAHSFEFSAMLCIGYSIVNIFIYEYKMN